MKKWSISLACLILGSVLGLGVSNHMLQGQAPAPTAIPREMTSYRDVVKRILPAIVSIEARAMPVRAKQPAQPKRRQQRSGDMPIPEELRRFFEEFEERRMPNEIPQMGFGSGFIVDPKGVILTNYHVVDGADQVEVTLNDGRKFTSKEIKVDRKTDLAIVRIPAPSALPYLELGDSDTMEIGDRVLAAGAPFGLTGSVTSGIISAKGRSNMRMNTYEDFIQTDAAINPGNSGGPLVNLDGKVIGINSAIKTRSGGFQGVGLAISSNFAKSVIKELEERGMVRRGYLGVQIHDLEPELATRLGVRDGNGVVVTQVVEGKPAAKAGVLAGDVVTSVAGKTVKDGRDLQRVVASLPIGKPAMLTVVRDGQPHSLKVTIDEQPDEQNLASVPSRQAPRPGAKEEQSIEKVGIDVSDLTEELADQLNLREGTKGVVITGVEANSPAAQAGMRRGMVVVKIDKKAVTSAKVARATLEKASLDEGVLLQVALPDGRMEYVLVKASR